MRSKPCLGYSNGMDCKDIFKGKRITLMGLGVLGRGAGDAEFLAQCGAQVLVTDKKTEDELAESVEKLKRYTNIAFRLGGHELSDFTHCDMVIKAAGVPLNSPEIAAAREANIPVYMSTALFAKYAMETGATVVGITGTRGKTTVTRMIFHCLKNAQKTAFLGGNIRGVSTLAMSREVKAGDIAVLELDSWQLQGFGDLRLSPQIAVFTNLMPDHQNYYKNMEEYFSDKANIFRFQKEAGHLFVGASVREHVQRSQAPIAPIIPEPIPAEWKLQLPGEHNRDNASLAVATLRALGLTEAEIRAGVESFEPVEGRLQFVHELNGAKIYNDNNASTPEATIAALRALKGQGHLTLIVGGTDKDVALNQLATEINSSVDSLVLFSGTGTDKLRSFIKIPYVEAQSLERALASALDATPAGGTVLFSPAFASFGPFVNYYDRNDQFLRLVTGAAS